jgi:hypothetical protein
MLIKPKMRFQISLLCVELVARLLDCHARADLAPFRTYRRGAAYVAQYRGARVVGKRSESLSPRMHHF